MKESDIWTLIWSPQYEAAQKLSLLERLPFWQKELKLAHPDYADRPDVLWFMLVKREVQKVKREIADKRAQWEKEMAKDDYFWTILMGKKTFEEWVS